MRRPSPPPAPARRAGLLAAALALAAATAALPWDALRAGIVERHAVVPGETALAEILRPGELDEYTIDLPRGGFVSLSFWRRGAGSWEPSGGTFTDDYTEIRSVGVGPRTIRNVAPLPHSGTYRILVGGAADSVGGYRIRFDVAGGRRFLLAGSAEDPRSELTFGALPDHEARVTLRWTGALPVTLGSLTGPDGSPLSSAEAPRTKKASSVQGGFLTRATGDHVLTLDVPEGTTEWSATVTLRGRPPKGPTTDHGSAGLPRPPSLELGRGGVYPQVRVRGERGGPNDMLLTASGKRPDAVLPDPRAGACARITSEHPDTAAEYTLRCANGYDAVVRVLERDAQGRVRALAADDVRTPFGTGAVELADLEYDALGRPTGWTEVRRFSGTGAVHTLVLRDVRRFGNGVVKSYVVEHTPPGGETRLHEFAPFEDR